MMALPINQTALTAGTDGAAEPDVGWMWLPERDSEVPHRWAIGWTLSDDRANPRLSGVTHLPTGTVQLGGRDAVSVARVATETAHRAAELSAEVQFWTLVGTRQRYRWAQRQRLLDSLLIQGRFLRSDSGLLHRIDCGTVADRLHASDRGVVGEVDLARWMINSDDGPTSYLGGYARLSRIPVSQPDPADPLNIPRRPTILTTTEAARLPETTRRCRTCRPSPQPGPADTEATHPWRRKANPGQQAHLAKTA